jgi:hypothetical protein
MIERHIHHLPLDLRQPPCVVILQEKNPPLLVQILAPVALLAIGLPPVFHNLTASTPRTPYFHNRHSVSSFPRLTTEALLSLSTTLVHRSFERLLVDLAPSPQEW